jgi:hypothetical protein
MLHVNGRDVRGDKKNLPPYPFSRAMKNSATVRKWKDHRFAGCYPGFSVDVVASNGSAAHGRTLLSTVRDKYVRARDWSSRRGRILHSDIYLSAV